MGFGFDPEASDVNNNDYLSGPVTVGLTSVEAKVGVSALETRETVRIYNSSTKVIYFGPPGVTVATGEPLRKKQWVSIPAGPNNPVHLITTAVGEIVIVQEMS